MFENVIVLLSKKVELELETLLYEDLRLVLLLFCSLKIFLLPEKVKQVSNPESQLK